MTIAELRSLRDANPFRTFAIHLADGKSFHIPHRDFLSIAPSGGTIIVYHSSGGLSILDLLLMTELSVDESTPLTPSSSAS